MKSKEKFFRIREFLDSGTQNAKIAQVTLCIVAIASLPALVFLAAAMGNAVQIFKQFETSKRFNKKQIRNTINYLRRQKLIEYIADKDGKTIVKITKKGETRLKAFDIDLI